MELTPTVDLTVGKVWVDQPQLQAGGGRVLSAAIWWIQEPAQVSLKGGQQSAHQEVVGFAWHVHEFLQVDMDIQMF